MDKITATAECVFCGARHRVNVYPSVDAQSMPRLSQRLMNGTFFEHNCNVCGKVYNAWYPMTYTDTHNRFIVFYTTDTREEVEIQELIKTRKEDFDDVFTNYTVRHVRTPNALREKIKIFTEGYDDRLLELIKVEILELGHEEKRFDEVDEVLFWVNEKGEMSLDFLEPDRDDSLTASVSKELYGYANEQCLKLLNKKYKNPLCVDLDWAIEVMAKHQIELM